MFICCILVMALILVLSGNSLAEDTSVLFVTGEWAPYTSEKLPGYGASTELISAVCKAGGIKPEYKFNPWKRTEMMVDRGMAFAAFPYALTENRKKKYYISDPLYYGADYFIYYVNNPGTSKPVKYRHIEDMISITNCYYS